MEEKPIVIPEEPQLYSYQAHTASHTGATVSSTVGQMLSVLTYVKQDTAFFVLDEKITAAIKYTAAEYGITVNSVIDKCTRKLSTKQKQISMRQFRTLVQNWRQKQDTTIEQLLLAVCRAESDRSQVRAFFEV